MGGLPVVVLPLQRGQHGDNPVLATIRQITLPQGVGYPRRIVAEFLHRLAVVSLVPGVHSLVQINRVAQPARLMNVMAYTRGDEVILVSIASVDQEFGHGITHGGPLDMLAQRPPTEVPEFFKVLLRTLEEGDVLYHPLPTIFVGNSLLNALAPSY